MEANLEHGTRADKRVEATASKPATVEDVARLARVSRQTVSNVINATHPVREATAERVRVAIQELDYKPNLGARRLRTNRSRTIGFCLEQYAGGISGVVLDRFLHALTQAAAKQGYRILVYAAETAEKELALIKTLVGGQEIDVVVLTGTYHGDPRPKALMEANIQYVAFGRPWTDTDSGERWVDVDGASGVALATEAIIKATGKPVAFLGWPPDGATGSDRRSGWQTVMVKHGLDTQHLMLTAEDTILEGRQVVARALAEGLTERAGGLVCSSDLLAVASGIELGLAGVDNWPLTGFDNTPTTEVLGISSVEQRPEEVAAEVMRLILDPTLPGNVLVKPELVLR